jgi:undecaprenyl-diphosphatase
MNQFELGILDALAGAIRHPVLDTTMTTFSWFGNDGRIWIAIAVLLLLFQSHRKAGVTLATGLILNLALVIAILKPLFDRVRPFVLNPDVTLLITPPADGGFPSGHTAASFAAATVLYHFNKRWGIAAYVFAALMGFSRLYLYVHFPTDIIAGAIAGILIGVVAIKLVDAAEVGKSSAQENVDQEDISHVNAEVE